MCAEKSHIRNTGGQQSIAEDAVRFYHQIWKLNPSKQFMANFADTFFWCFGRIFPSPVKVKGSTGGRGGGDTISLVSTYFVGCFMAGVTN